MSNVNSNPVMSLLIGLSQAQLIDKTRILVKEERRVTTEILWCFREIERRRVHLEMGYGSLYDFATRFLAYSEGAAYRRISASRCLREMPELEAALKDGRLSLTTLSMAHRFFRVDGKLKQKIYSTDEKLAVIKTLEGKSRLQAEQQLAAISPHAASSETVRFVNEAEIEVRFTINSKLRAKIEQLKSLISHQYNGTGYAELLEYLVDRELKRVNPEKRKPRRAGKTSLAEPSQAAQSAIKQHTSPGDVTGFAPKQTLDMTQEPVQKSAIRMVRGLAQGTVESQIQEANDDNGHKSEALTARNPSYRYIPAQLRRQLWERAKWQCEYVNEHTQQRCQSRYELQIDHEKPLALGGETRENNLRLLCRQHNIHMAAEILGEDLIKHYVPTLG